jgi:Fic family protein
MTEVRRTGNYEQWVKFFLEAIYESAADATVTIDKLTALHDKNIATINGLGLGAPTALKLFAFLEENPIIEISKTATALAVSYNTIALAVSRLCEAGILIPTSEKLRKRTFSYAEYLEILKDGTEQ